MPVRHVRVASALLSLILASAAPSFAEISSEGPGACSGTDLGDPAKSLLLPLGELLGAGREADVTLTVRLHDHELFTEAYRVTAPTADAALPIWLGGVRQADGLRDAKGALRQVTVAVAVDGRDVFVDNLAGLFARDARARRAAAPAATILSLDTKTGPASPQPPVAAGAKAIFWCPDSEEACNAQFDDCTLHCDFGEPNCMDFCYRQQDTCQHGDLTTFETNTLLSYRALGRECAFYPWYNYFQPKYWDSFETQYRHQRVNRIHCPATGAVYDTVTAEWMTYPVCFRKSPYSCSGGRYLNDDCRW